MGKSRKRAAPGGGVKEGKSGEDYRAGDAERDIAVFLQMKRPRQAWKLLYAVREGLPFLTLENLAKRFGTPQKEMARVLAITPSTLARRKVSGKLKPDESDRVVRLARIGTMADALMHRDGDAARRWLTTPLEILGGESPMQRASTELGARDVERLIGRLRHGVFS